MTQTVDRLQAEGRKGNTSFVLTQSGMEVTTVSNARIALVLLKIKS
jgi:hypothetical protein